MSTDIVRTAQNGRRAGMVVYNGTIYLTGQIADEKDADIATQTRQALARIDRLLAEAGSGKERLLSAQIWLKTMDDFAAMNAVWDAWVAPDLLPTRCCCGGVELADPACLVEIVVTAAAAS